VAVETRLTVLGHWVL